MKRVLEQSELNFDASALPNPALWTVVIPAAGMGTRLNYGRPKILYPISGRPILYHLLDIFGELASHVVVVGSPSGSQDIQDAIARHSKRSMVAVCQQESPRGMADAVLCARDKVLTENTLVVWGDQVTARERTARLCMLAHEGRPRATLTLPTYMRKDPYINLLRDTSDRIIQVQQRREGEISVPIGENDCGMFLFNSARLFSLLEEQMTQSRATGTRTGEFNLLPLLPLFEQGDGATQTLRIAREDETLGVNTTEEAVAAERVLASRVKENAHV